MPRFPLHAVLWLDAVSCAGLGLLLCLGSGPLSALLGLPSGLLLGAGLLLLPVAVVMAMAARMRVPPRWLLLLIVDGNVAWVLGSVLVLIAGTPTGLGVGVVLGQAGLVAVLTAIEAGGLRGGRTEHAPS